MAREGGGAQLACRRTQPKYAPGAQSKKQTCSLKHFTLRSQKIPAFKTFFFPPFTGKNGFATATKLGTTNEFFVATTKNFAAVTKRFVDKTKHFLVVTKYFCYPYFNK